MDDTEANELRQRVDACEESIRKLSQEVQKMPKKPTAKELIMR